MGQSLGTRGNLPTIVPDSAGKSSKFFVRGAPIREEKTLYQSPGSFQRDHDSCGGAPFVGRGQTTCTARQTDGAAKPGAIRKPAE
jgi:hypothetical protein